MKTKDQKISAGVGTIIIIIVAVTVGMFVWKYEKNLNLENEKINTIAVESGSVKNSNDKVDLNNARENRSSVDWNNEKFSSCGKKERFQGNDWWTDFSKEVEKENYFSDVYIKYSIESINNNDYLNPEKNIFTYETYCKNEKYKNNAICLSKKLSINDFNNYSQGCLSADGRAFLAVFSGGYLGGSNHVFRYDVESNILEEAQKVNNSQATYSIWLASPTSFGKQKENIIEMTGKSGDAGCSLNTGFEYDIAKNQVRVVKKCSQCMNEKLRCSDL